MLYGLGMYGRQTKRKNGSDGKSWQESFQCISIVMLSLGTSTQPPQQRSTDSMGGDITVGCLYGSTFVGINIK